MHCRFIEKSIYVQYFYYVLFTQKGTLVNLQNGVQLLLTLNEHNNCFITLICLKYFSKPRKDRYIFLLKGYLVKIKNEYRNLHFNSFWFQIFHADNVMRTFYKLAVTMQENVILLHD